MSLPGRIQLWAQYVCPGRASGDVLPSQSFHAVCPAQGREATVTPCQSEDLPSSLGAIQGTDDNVDYCGDEDTKPDGEAVGSRQSWGLRL